MWTFLKQYVTFSGISINLKLSGNVQFVKFLYKHPKQGRQSKFDITKLAKCISYVHKIYYFKGTSYQKTPKQSSDS